MPLRCSRRGRIVTRRSRRKEADAELQQKHEAKPRRNTCTGSRDMCFAARQSTCRCVRDRGPSRSYMCITFSLSFTVWDHKSHFRGGGVRSTECTIHLYSCKHVSLTCSTPPLPRAQAVSRTSLALFCCVAAAAWSPRQHCDITGSHLTAHRHRGLRRAAS